jgi:hypothetical protein
LVVVVVRVFLVGAELIVRVLAVGHLAEEFGEFVFVVGHELLDWRRKFWQPPSP